MTEIPIIVNTNEVTVGGVVDQVELQLSLGTPGQRGSRIFSGDVSPLTLPVDSTFWAGYTEFIPGDVYIERSVDVISLWEWKLQIGGYTWVKTAEVAVSNEGSEPLDQDLEAIAALSGTTGLLRKTATNTWTLDTTSYLSPSYISEGTDPGTAPNSSIFYDTDAADPPIALTLSQADANYANRLVTTVDNTVPRFNGTGGALQTSGVTIDDGAEVSASGYVRAASGAVYDQWFVDGVRRFVQQTVPSSLGLFAADDSGVWSGGGKKVWEIDRATGKVTLVQVGSTAGLEFGSSGPRQMVGTGGPSGISAPVGSTWRQTDANTSHGNLTGLLWNKVGTGTTEGTDWLVDYEGRWVSYTPSTTNLTDGTATGSFTRVGKVVHFKANYVAGTVGTSPRLGLPTSMPGSKRRPCSGQISDSGSNYYGCLAQMYDNYVQFFSLGASGVAVTITSTSPFIWTTNDELNVTGTYEIA